MTVWVLQVAETECEPDFTPSFLRTRTNPFVSIGLVLLAVFEVGEPVLDHVDRGLGTVSGRLGGEEHQPSAETWYRRYVTLLLMAATQHADMH